MGSCRSFSCTPGFEVLFPWQAHSAERTLALFANHRAPAVIAPPADRNMLVLRTGIADHFDEAVPVAFGALLGEEHGAGRIKLRAAFETQVAICVGVAGGGSNIFSAAAGQKQSDRGTEQEQKGNR